MSSQLDDLARAVRAGLSQTAFVTHLETYTIRDEHGRAVRDTVLDFHGVTYLISIKEIETHNVPVHPIGELR